jgi:FtsH-binding integral membrane protein
MNDFNRTFGAVDARSADTSVDAGLRAFMLGVYQKLALGLAVAGGLAFVVGANLVPALTAFVYEPTVFMVIRFAPMVLLLGAMFLMRRPSPLGSGIFYWAIVTLMGLSLSMWVAGATGTIELSRRGGAVMNPQVIDIAKAFFITAGAFGGLSLFGYTTKINLRPIGVFASYALIGAVLLGLVSLLFPPSSMLGLLIMGVVLVVSGILIAFDTQMLKENYYDFQGDVRSLAVMTNQGALNFFISFVNIFQIMMSLLSND